MKYIGRRGRLGDVELLVLLTILRLGEHAYGVSIAKEIQATDGRAVALASLYLTLERLEQRGLVRSELGEPTAERGGRAKRYFTVTPKGLAGVKAARRVLTTLWSGIPELGDAT
jgi:DNA-binding PadR family transcriptional regulator